MYVNPKDRTVKAAQDARKRVHEQNEAARRKANSQAIAKVAKAGK